MNSPLVTTSWPMLLDEAQEEERLTLLRLSERKFGLLRIIKKRRRGEGGRLHKPKSHPRLNKAYFSGIAKKLLPLPDENPEGLEIYNELQYDLAYQHSLKQDHTDLPIPGR